MGIDRLKETIEEQHRVYESLKEGDPSRVCYQAFRDGKWGTMDANAVNRRRLSYYLLYWKTGDEDTIVFLFEEELKDRETNSFQGIGSTLRVLTQLMRGYNGENKYGGLLERAKNANFDCACGYDPEEEVDDDFESNTLLDCIYLCQELEYREVMGKLVDEWKESITKWSAYDRRALIRFHSYLGREPENEALYQEQLAEIISADSKGAREVVAGYADLIQYYVRQDNYEKAYHYCKTVTEMAELEQVKRIRLFGSILEACFEITAHMARSAGDLWVWARAGMEEMLPTARYGNLYQKGIAAAKAMNDPCVPEWEQEYADWLERIKCVRR